MPKKLLHRRFLHVLLGCAATVILLSGSVAALAWPWNSEPQPLLEQVKAIQADGGSPLAWDNSRRALWSFHYGRLQEAHWNGRTFVERERDVIRANPDAGLLVDSGTHFVYCVDGAGIPHVIQPLVNQYVAAPIGDAPVARLVALDPRTHAVFAYDTQATGIRRFVYDAKKKLWSSAVISSGLGAAGDAGVFDSTASILYTTHAMVDAAVPRHPNAQTITDPAGIGELKPWPLVATSWDGSAWTSRVIDETGVPQQPAVRASDHRVFYAHREDFDSLHYYQPPVGTQAEAFGTLSGCSGVDSFEDNDSYPIKKPQCPPAWGSYYSSEVSMINVGGTVSGSQWNSIALKAPITIVPYYQPAWSQTALPTRLAKFRAVINPRQNRLVQHRVQFSGEVYWQQTGWQLAGYLYKDANGTLVTQIGVWWKWNGESYPVLGPDFDPANPPANFSKLADANASFETQQSMLAHLGGNSLNAAAPLLPSYLAGPAQVRLRTFGHSYASDLLLQPGGRYRLYKSDELGSVIPTSIAVDVRSGPTFYTQAQASSKDASRQSVWIVMVY